MKFLLDTHSLIWFLDGNSRLSSRARQWMEDEINELFVSLGSLWKMAIKISLGKLEWGQPFEQIFPYQLQENAIEILDISVAHLNAVCLLSFHHRDPFDRLIIAQSRVEFLPIISVDDAFDAYDINRVW